MALGPGLAPTFFTFLWSTCHALGFADNRWCCQWPPLVAASWGPSTFHFSMSTHGFYLFSVALGITNLTWPNCCVIHVFNWTLPWSIKKKEKKKRASDWLPLGMILDWLNFDVSEILIGCSNCTLICPNYFGGVQSPQPGTLNLSHFILVRV